MNKISDSELEVMKILWEKGAITSPEIINALSKSVDWSRNTIKTLITRLVNKKVIEQKKEEGQLYIYKPLISEKEYKKIENENFVTKLYKGSINNMLLNFVEEKQISKKDLEKLLEIIERE